MRLLSGVIVAAVALAAPAAAQAGTAWVPYGNDSIGALDLDTETVSPVVENALPDARTIAFAPGADRYWLAAYEDGLLTGATAPFSNEATAVGTTAPATDVEAVAVSPDGSRVYVTRANSLLVVDAATRTVMDTETVVSAGGLAVAPDGGRVYVKGAGANTVYIYDVASQSLSADTITVGGGDSDMAVTPDGRRLVTSDNGSATPGTVSVVDLASGVVTPIAVSDFPRDLAVSADGRFAYVLDGNNPRVKVIDVASTAPAVVDTIAWTTANDGNAIAVTPDGSRAFVTDRLADRLQVLDLDAGAASGTVPLGQRGSDVAMLPNQGPRAAFTAASAGPGAPTTFSAAGAVDPDGMITRYDWDFGDGTTLPDGGPAPAHTYAAAGTYTVALKVTDDLGISDQRAYTGQQFLHYGGPQSRTSAPVTVAAPSVGGLVTPGGTAIDALAPLVTVTKPRDGKSYKRRTFRKLRGTATDRAPAGVTAAGVARVRLGLQRQLKRKRCRAVRTSGKLARSRRCSARTPLKVKGVDAWSYKLRRKLPAGRYVLRVVATDRNGAKSTTVVRFRLR